MAFDGDSEAASPVVVDQLRAYVSRIENIEGEITELNDDKKEVYAEAKAVGFCVKTLKRVIQRRRMDRADKQEADAMLELYESALDGSANGSHKDDDFLS